MTSETVKKLLANLRPKEQFATRANPARMDVRRWDGRNGR